MITASGECELCQIKLKHKKIRDSLIRLSGITGAQKKKQARRKETIENFVQCEKLFRFNK